MGRLVGIILSFLIWFGVSAETLSGYTTVDSVAARMASMPLCPLEGIWQMAADGAIFAVERVEPSETETFPRELRLVVVRSPQRRVRPGSVMGTARPTVKPGVYEAKLHTQIADLGALTVPRSFLLTVGNHGSTLAIESVKSPLKFNLLRLIPYLYRVVKVQDSRPKGLEGAVRLYPPVTANPLTPVYL